MRTHLFFISIVGLIVGCPKPETSAPYPESSRSLAEASQRHPGFTQVQPGLLVGKQPTKEILTELAAAGLQSVVDLKGPMESRGFPEAAESQELGLTYYSLPIRSKSDISWTHAAQLHQLLQQATSPVLVHCQSGNRVGALFALSAMAEHNLNVAQSIEVGRRHGLTTLESHVRAILENGQPETPASSTTMRPSASGLPTSRAKPPGKSLPKESGI